MFEWKKLAVSTTTRDAVLRALQVRADTRPMSAVLEEALKLWLEKNACDDPPAAQAAARGYQWKSLFLPAGTLVRFTYKRQLYHAEIRGDRLVYEGRSYSPRQLILKVTGTVRNAWRELWLRCPGDFRWHLADTRRFILRRTPRGLHPRGVDVAVRHPDTAGAASLLAARPTRAPFGPARDGVVQAGGAATANQHAGGALEPASAAPVESHAQNALLHTCGLTQLRGCGEPGAVTSAQRSAILYRDDVVRADQPDLSSGRTGGGRGGAGRSGPRDRRWGGYVYTAIAALRREQAASR